MLDQCDLACVIDPYEAELRINKQHSFENVPESVPIYSTGVIPFTDTTATEALLDTWWDIHDSNSIERDQASFRLALYRTQIDFLSFSHHYNFIVGRSIHAVGRVKVFHWVGSTDPEMREVATNRINDTENLRVQFGIGDIESLKPSMLNVYSNINDW